MKDLSGKWGIIIGGSSGLGLATAKKLSEHGMNLIIIHRDRKSDMEQINSAFDLLRTKVKVKNFNVDALNSAKREALLDTLEDICGKQSIYLLLHSIAKGNLKVIDKEKNSLTSEDFALTIHAMGVNYYEWVMDLLKRNLFLPKARTIAFTSEGSSKVHPYYAAVSAAKATIESISRSLALELAPYGITSNCVMAGTTDTRAFRMIPNNEELEEWSKQRNPNKRLTKPKEVADAVYLLCRSEADWINGIVLQVDGGEHLR